MELKESNQTFLLPKPIFPKYSRKFIDNILSDPAHRKIGKQMIKT